MVTYSCENMEPSEEGFWESFFRNGPIVAIIHKMKARVDLIKKKCDLFAANPKNYENHDGHNSITAIKILPKQDQIQLLHCIYNLGEVIRRDLGDMSKAKREDYIKALDGCGIKVQYNKVKEQYTWEPSSLSSVLIVDALATLFTAGVYGIVNLLSGNGVSRQMQTEVSELPSAMDKKGYESTEDFVELCKEVSRVCGQAMQLAKIKPSGKQPDPNVAKLVQSAIKVYNLEVKETCYAMVKVLTGLDSKTGFLAAW